MKRDRRNLTPDQLALVMGRHYNYLKGPGHGAKNPAAEKAGSTLLNQKGGRLSTALGSDYGVSGTALVGAGKFAAAVDTLRAVEVAR